jgi:hypothetical protein
VVAAQAVLMSALPIRAAARSFPCHGRVAAPTPSARQSVCKGRSLILLSCISTKSVVEQFSKRVDSCSSCTLSLAACRLRLFSRCWVSMLACIMPPYVLAVFLESQWVARMASYVHALHTIFYY